jgi:catechol 2,3-dioxygenase-like lactoylglutathione lyase family enzyme
MLEGIQHVAITVDNLDAARHFYGEVLGLPELPRPDFSIPGIWYAVGAQMIHMAEVEEHTAHRANHFALQVRDLDAVAASLTAAGVKVRMAPYTSGAGHQATLRDPAGNLIELNCPEAIGAAADIAAADAAAGTAAGSPPR